MFWNLFIDDTLFITFKLGEQLHKIGPVLKEETCISFDSFGSVGERGIVYMLVRA